MKVLIVDRFARSWPDHERGLPAERASLEDALTRLFETDAHFQALELPRAAPLRRVSTRVLEHHPVRMTALVFDVDAPAHGAGAADAWRATFRERAIGLPGTPCVYWTRGGARIVYRLAAPFLVRTDADALRWSRGYLLCAVRLHAHTGIVADPATSDFTRLFRLPHATREGVPQALGLCCGEATAIGAWPGGGLGRDELLAALRSLASSDSAWARKLPILAPPVEHRAPVAPSVAGSSALAFACRKLEEAGKGQRNKELYGRTHWLAGLIARGELTVDVVTRTLVDCATRIGLSPAEARRTIASALRGST